MGESPVINRLDFTPSPIFTVLRGLTVKCIQKNWLAKNGFPNKPVYQMYHQQGNKADMIKGRCDILIDDSYFNVRKQFNLDYQHFY